MAAPEAAQAALKEVVMRVVSPALEALWEASSVAVAREATMEETMERDSVVDPMVAVEPMDVVVQMVAQSCRCRRHHHHCQRHHCRRRHHHFLARSISEMLLVPTRLAHLLPPPPPPTSPQRTKRGNKSSRLSSAAAGVRGAAARAMRSYWDRLLPPVKLPP